MSNCHDIPTVMFHLNVFFSIVNIINNYYIFVITIFKSIIIKQHNKPMSFFSFFFFLSPLSSASENIIDSSSQALFREILFEYSRDTVSHSACRFSTSSIKYLCVKRRRRFLHFYQIRQYIMKFGLEMWN